MLAWDRRCLRFLHGEDELPQTAGLERLFQVKLNVKFEKNFNKGSRVFSLMHTHSLSVPLPLSLRPCAREETRPTKITSRATIHSSRSMPEAACFGESDGGAGMFIW
jgi:hypothetical protein